MDLLAFILAISAEGITDEQVQTALNAYIAEHPEAVTTVTDGSITKAKLDSNLQATVDDVGGLKSAIEDLEAGSLSALGATAGQIPLADGAGSWQWTSPDTDIDECIGIVVNGNKATLSATIGQFVVLKNSTISGCPDGLYTAAKVIPANNTEIDNTYLTAVSGGGLNAIKNDLTYKGNTIKELLITEIGSYSGFYAAGYHFFLLHVEGNAYHMRDYMIPVGIDKFGFSAELIGSSTIYVKVEGLWHENGVLDINTLETGIWSGATFKLIGVM